MRATTRTKDVRFDQASLLARVYLGPYHWLVRLGATVDPSMISISIF